MLVFVPIYLTDEKCIQRHTHKKKKKKKKDENNLINIARYNSKAKKKVIID